MSNFPESDWCRNRVPDHTDMVDCGNKPVVVGTKYCIKCLVQHVDFLKWEVGNAESFLKAKRAEYEQMAKALERHQLPLLAKVI